MEYRNINASKASPNVLDKRPFIVVDIIDKSGEHLSVKFFCEDLTLIAYNMDEDLTLITTRYGDTFRSTDIVADIYKAMPQDEYVLLSDVVILPKNKIAL